MIALLFAVALSQQQINDQCTYQAGVARHVQDIRHTGDTWSQFQAITQNLYKDDEGYRNLLATAYLVYHQVPIVFEPSQVFELIFDSCIAAHYKAHQQGHEFNL